MIQQSHYKIQKNLYILYHLHFTDKKYNEFEEFRFPYHLNFKVMIFIQPSQNYLNLKTDLKIFQTKNINNLDHFMNTL